MIWEVTLLLFLGVFALAWFYSKRCLSYWSDQGVAGPQPTVFIGNPLYFFSKKPFWKAFDDEYKVFKHHKMHGRYFLHSKSLTVTDIELMKHIFVKDFDHFVDRRDFNLTSGDDSLNEMLLTSKGESWKNLRSIMSPTFSSGKMKVMFPIVAEKGEKLVKSIVRRMQKSPILDIKNLAGNYGLEVISSCAFGIECNALEEDNGTFIQKATALTATTGWATFKLAFVMLLPKLSKMLKMGLFNKEILFFRDVIVQTLAERENNDIRRGDFVDLMFDAKKDQDLLGPNKKYPVTNNTIVAESVLFFFAGYETMTNSICFASHLIAQHPDVQDKLCEELQGFVDDHEEFTYQDIMEAKYLEAVIAECLRVHPPAVLLERKCTKDYKVPGTNAIVEKGTMVTIPAWSIHHDPEYWENPMEFNPDRFLPENKHKINNYAYMPFGHGPRNCIGMRFAQMELKLAIAHLVFSFNLKVAPGHEEIHMDTSPMQYRPSKDGVELIFEAR